MKTIRHLAFLLFLSFISMPLYAAGDTIPAQEFDALQIIYSCITNTDKDLLLSNWDISRTDLVVTDWEGVRVENGHITELDLSGKGLSGEFMWSNRDLWLTYLPKLRSLNLSNNNFTGRFPQVELTVYGGQLSTDIEYINVSNNQFSGEIRIPENCIKLKELIVENNSIGFIFLPPSPDLRIVNARNNVLFGVFSPLNMPDSVSLGLDTLDIRDNKLKFADLWTFSDPRGIPHEVLVIDENTGRTKIDTVWGIYKNIYYEPGVTFLYAPQDSIFMHQTVINKKLRKQPGDSVYVELPDVGQHSTRYPDIRDSLAYQWYRDGVALAADTFPYFRRSSLTSSDFGRYYCAISTRTRSGRLEALSLCTESILIANEVNQPPVISISNGVSQYQRIQKGSRSPKTELSITDDTPIGVGGGSFGITHFSSNLEQIQYIEGIVMKDVSPPMWSGLDSVLVKACDYEGACDSLTLYYEIYDILYAPPLLSVTFPDSGVVRLKWDTAFYNTQIEKATKYYVTTGVDTTLLGLSFTRTDSIRVAQGVNTADIAPPAMTTEYVLRLAVFPENEKETSIYPAYMLAQMPIRPDSLLSVTGDSSGVVLSWKHTSGPKAMMLMATNYNAIYRSKDGGTYSLLLDETAYDQTSYTDLTVEKGHSYQYKLVKKATVIYWDYYHALELPGMESNSISITIDGTTDAPVSEVTGNFGGEIKIYPNPIKNQLLIDKGSLTIRSVSIIDTNGKVCKKYMSLSGQSAPVVLDITSLQPGNYFVNIETDKGIVTRQIIRE